MPLLLFKHERIGKTQSLVLCDTNGRRQRNTKLPAEFFYLCLKRGNGGQPLLHKASRNLFVRE